MTPQNCRFTARGATFTANGAPDVRQVGEVTIVGLSERVGTDFDITGAVDWKTGLLMSPSLLPGARRVPLNRYRP